MIQISNCGFFENSKSTDVMVDKYYVMFVSLILEDSEL